MRSISMVWTNTVEEMEWRYGLAAVQEIAGSLQTISFRRGLLGAAPTLNVFGDWTIPMLPPDAPYQSIQWYIEQSYDADRESVVGSRLLDVILNEPWQRSNAHYDLLLIGNALIPTKEYPVEQEALALSVPGRATVISALPLRQISDERLRLFTMRRVVGHQLGHLFGIPSALRDDVVVENSGERHCAHVCAMREATDLEALITLSVEELKARVLLCPACWDDLLRVMADSYFGTN